MRHAGAPAGWWRDSGSRCRLRDRWVTRRRGSGPGEGGEASPHHLAGRRLRRAPVRHTDTLRATGAVLIRCPVATSEDESTLVATVDRCDQLSGLTELACIPF